MQLTQKIENSIQQSGRNMKTEMLQNIAVGKKKEAKTQIRWKNATLLLYIYAQVAVANLKSQQSNTGKNPSIVVLY